MYFKKTLRNRAHNGTVEPQNEPTHFEKIVLPAPSSLMASWFWSLHALSKCARLWRVFFGSKNAKFVFDIKILNSKSPYAYLTSSSHRNLRK